MAKVFRIGRLISLPLVSRFLGGASAGILILLFLHPLSRPLLIDGLRPTPAFLESSLTLSAPLIRPPDPTDLESAAFWVGSYVAHRKPNVRIERDQLLLLAEICQAGAAADQRNAFWKQAESLIQTDLGNDLASQAAWKASLTKPYWSLNDKVWRRAIGEELKNWSGGTYRWHDEVMRLGPSYQTARVTKNVIEFDSGPSPLSLSFLESRLSQVDSGSDFPASIQMARITKLFEGLLTIGLFLVVVLVKGQTRGQTLPVVALALSLAVLGAAATRNLTLPMTLLALSGAYALPSRGSGEADRVIKPFLWGALLLSSLCLAIQPSTPTFSYIANPELDYRLTIVSAVLALGVGLAKSKLSEGESDKFEWSLFQAGIWVGTAVLLFAAATATSSVLLELSH